MKERLRKVVCLAALAGASCATPLSSTAERAPAYAVKAALASSALEIEVKALGAYQLNTEVPLRFFPSEEQVGTVFELNDYELPHRKLEPCSAPQKQNCHTQVTVPLKRTDVSEVRGELRVSVCTPSHCVVERVPVRVERPVNP